MWLVLALAVLWVFDFLAVRLPLPPHRRVFATIPVREFYEVPLKSGKVEITYAGTASEVCVRSLAPHFGDPPCWWLTRHSQMQVICCSQ